MSADTFFALQTAVAGRYSLVRELGRGGMGVVYLARDVALDRPVAIKLLPPSLAADTKLRERFLREARTVAQLSHPNIVPIHSVEDREGLVFFVMSYVDGETLGTRVRRAGPLAASEATRVMQEVAWALGHAHARGIVHRDVKPDNVLLDAESGRAVVTDFGIAVTGLGASVSDTALGTPQYLSPEQARGEPVEPRSDLYSLGATMWFALTGAPPFTGTLPQLLHRHATGAVPSLVSVKPHAPIALVRVVDRCLAKRVDERPGSAAELASALGEAETANAQLPVPLRKYLEAVSGSEVQNYAVAGAVFAAGAFVINGMAVPSGAIFNVNSILATIAAFSSVAAFAVSGTLLGLRVRHVRDLTRAGFDYRAVVRAVERERSHRIAEGMVDPVQRISWFRIGGAVSAIVSGVLAYTSGAFGPGFAWATVCATSTLLTIRSVTAAGTSQVLGVKGAGLRALERWMFRELGVKNAPRAITDGEATVVALNGAIQDLYDALPSAARAQLEQVPAIAAKLEDDAMRLRARVNDPNAAERLRTVVAAMESLRLDLLRIQAGTVEASSLTQQLDAARDVGEQIDALLKARDDVREFLRPETTPA